MKNLKTKSLLLSAVILLTSLFSSNASAEEINGYTFATWSNAGIKVEEMMDGGVKQYLVSLALRAKEGQTINQIEGTIQLDPKVFDLEDLSKNLATSFVKWDIFTNSQDIDPNQLKQGLLTYKGSTDVGFTTVAPAEAFGVLVKVRADNQSPTTSIKIQSDSFRLTDTKKDPTVNLFTGEVVKDVTGLAVGTPAPVVVAPVTTVTPVVVAAPIVQPDTSKVNTGPKENVMFIMLTLLILAGTIYMKKTEKNV